MPIRHAVVPSAWQTPCADARWCRLSTALARHQRGLIAALALHQRGISTLSTIWITPFVARTSGVVTTASSAVRKVPDL